MTSKVLNYYFFLSHIPNWIKCQHSEQQTNSIFLKNVPAKQKAEKKKKRIKKIFQEGFYDVRVLPARQDVEVEKCCKFYWTPDDGSEEEGGGNRLLFYDSS
jgi:hypothetical protein